MYEIPEYKKIRAIIDTDAACEADDPFAIVQALLSPKLIVKGIVAEHFNEEGTAFAPLTIENNEGAVLPSTGGSGTMIFYVVGGLLIIGAAIVLVARRKAHE